MYKMGDRHGYFDGRVDNHAYNDPYEQYEACALYMNGGQHQSYAYEHDMGANNAYGTHYAGYQGQPGYVMDYHEEEEVLTCPFSFNNVHGTYLSSRMLDDLTSRGLCYKCGEKNVIGHLNVCRAQHVRISIVLECLTPFGTRRKLIPQQKLMEMRRQLICYKCVGQWSPNHESYCRNSHFATALVLEDSNAYVSQVEVQICQGQQEEDKDADNEIEDVIGQFEKMSLNAIHAGNFQEQDGNEDEDEDEDEERIDINADNVVKEQGNMDYQEKEDNYDDGDIQKDSIGYNESFHESIHSQEECDHDSFSNAFQPISHEDFTDLDYDSISVDIDHAYLDDIMQNEDIYAHDDDLYFPYDPGAYEDAYVDHGQDWSYPFDSGNDTYSHDDYLIYDSFYDGFPFDPGEGSSDLMDDDHYLGIPYDPG